MRNFAFGLCVGAGLVWVALRPSPALPERPAAAAPAPACPEPVTCETDALVAAQAQQIADLSAEAFGLPLSWPDGALQAASEAAIRWAAEGCDEGVELVGLDCSEPPCLASMRLGDRRAAEVKAACPRWTEVLSYNGYVSAQADCDGEPVLYAVYPVTPWGAYRDAQDPDRLGANEQTRLRVREQDLLKRRVCDPDALPE